MASHAPDARDLVSWEDAFQYPLPVIRRLEQQLQSGVSDNREKVRALVGSGYRDLLGTADRIIDMNGDMQTLEDIIGDIGHKCNSRAVSKIATNHQKLVRHRAEEQVAQRRPAAEVALLQSCLAACRRLMKSNIDPLLAARLLLLARLLQNSAAKSAEGARLLKAQRNQLASLRGRLLFVINEKLAEINLSRAQMLDLLLAYSLITTSSLADVLRHLLRVRQQSIVDLSSIKKRKGIIKAIDLLVATLEQATSVFPRRMSDAMERVTGPHILQDEALRAVLDFDLNIYERWISNDIRSFVPWLRNNDLAKDSLTSTLDQWAQNACSTITSGLDALLSVQNAPLRINHLREKTIRHLLEHNTSSAEFDKEELLMTMRRMFRDRLFTIAQDRAHTIELSVKDVLSTSLKEDHQVRNLWDNDTSKLDLRRGAHAFRQGIVARSKGMSPSLQRLSSTITEWTSSIDDVRKVAKEMRQTRWADELDLDNDDPDTPNHSEKYQALLAATDPTDLTAHLTAETSKALTASIEAISAAGEALSTSPSPGAQALYLLRILRLIPLSAADSPSALAPSAHHIQSTLHSLLATSILSTSTSSSPSVEATLFTTAPATQLWHAPPDHQPLPVLPSPGPFRLLRAVSKAMTDVGLDVWTPAAVRVVREGVQQVVVDAARAFVAHKAEGAADARVENGTAGVEEKNLAAEGQTEASDAQADVADEPQDPPAATDATQDPIPEPPAQDAAAAWPARATQALFDAVYLREALCRGGARSGGMAGVVEELRTESGVGEAEFERLVRNAGAYHRRSYLLFGVLAG